MPKIQKRRRRLAVFAAAMLLVSLLALPTGAKTMVSRYPSKVSDINVKSYPSVPIYVNKGERLPVDGHLINSTTYIPLRSFFEKYAPGAKLTYYASIRTAELKGEGLTVSARDGSHILYANGRCLYADTPIRILSDGTMYVPIRMLSKVLSLDVFWSEKYRSVTLSGTPTPLEDGATYYSEEDLYWLSRIISAEARGEPFIGQVAVGNVVYNRKAHPAYPGTVKGVIFDRQGGVVQFSPVDDGSIWQTPHATSVTAAKVCMEGYTVSDRILFFYAPSMVSSTWIERNRPYAFTIAGHRFFY
ncbi:MAG: copper amine oxidase [Ruminococcaceae bacterium]|nr:copper amine oxidase [Oscillospiraceae bacterium]